jgi:nucleoside-diphosphate-sugar epimerase
MQGPLILGSTGRVGRALRAVWPGAAVWHGRTTGDWQWDMAEPAPPLPGRPTAIICLAGATDGDADRLANNTTCALAALALARRDGIWPLLILSSAAVYGRAGTPGHEDAPFPPTTPYGAAKQAMELALHASLRPDEPALILRMANVAGCDAVFASMARGDVLMDRFPDGLAPRRSYIGPVTLARTLLALVAVAPSRPMVLNLAQPALLGMDAIAQAACARWTDRPAPPDALPVMHLDTGRLTELVPVPDATPGQLVAEARASGWTPA